MIHLEQLRAGRALKFWEELPTRASGDPAKQSKSPSTTGVEGGDALRGLAYRILSHGLLATLAFAAEKGEGYETFMQEIGCYLSTPTPAGRGLIPVRCNTVRDLLRYLTSHDSDVLHGSTKEALAYLAYLKRLAPAKPAK